MYMAVKHLRGIAARLLAAGRSPTDRVTVVCNASMPEQVVVDGTLGEVERIEPRLVTPAIVVVGAVGDLREHLDWYLGPLRENRLG